MVSLQTKCVWISIGLSMSDTYSIRKLGGDKIAFLGLLVAALLTARLVVGLRSTLVLSEPIPLRRAGLSMSVPIGNGWQSDGKWRDHDDVFILGSTFLIGPSETAWVICRYTATAGEATPMMWFEREKGKVDGVITEINETRTDTFIMEWARVKGQEGHLTMLLGTAILPNDGRLDIQVIEITGDAEQAEQVFASIVENVNLQ